MRLINTCDAGLSEVFTIEVMRKPKSVGARIEKKFTRKMSASKTVSQQHCCQHKKLAITLPSKCSD
jgi:hypothetical protein